MKIPPGWDLPIAIRSQFGDRSGRQRAIFSDGHLVLVVHEIPSERTKHRDGVYFWRQPCGEWRTTARGQAKPALTKLISEYEAEITRLEELHEVGTTATQTFKVLERLGPLKRAIRNCSDALAKANEQLNSAETSQDFQPFADHASDVARSGELLHHDARNALDFHIALQGEIQAQHTREVEKATHRLNTLATVFLPVTAVASVFGMNLHSGLEDAPSWMFWCILVGSVVAGLLVSEVLTAFKLRNRSR